MLARTASERLEAGRICFYRLNFDPDPDPDKHRPLTINQQTINRIFPYSLKTYSLSPSLHSYTNRLPAPGPGETPKISSIFRMTAPLDLRGKPARSLIS